MLKRAILILMLSFFLFPTNALSNDREKGLKKALAQLKEIQEIGWVEFEENNVYIGWKSIPGDFGMINRAAAAIGNNAIQFGTHIWSVKDDQKGWRPGDAPYYCATTARGGKVKDSSCK